MPNEKETTDLRAVQAHQVVVAAGGVRARHYDANDGGGGESAEEDELRDSEAVEKSEEKRAGSRMINR